MMMSLIFTGIIVRMLVWNFTHVFTYMLIISNDIYFHYESVTINISTTLTMIMESDIHDGLHL